MRKQSQSRNKKVVKEPLFTEELVEALKSEDKTSLQAELIRRKTAGLSFFTSYYEDKLEDIHLQACYKFKYQFMKKGSNVFRIFQSSDKFYILLNGIIEMHAIKPSDEEEVEKDNSNKPGNNQINNESQNNNLLQKNNNTPLKEEKKEIILYLQKILKSGCCFGEIGLICNKSRTATITCAEDSHFAILEKQDFVAILKPIEEKKMMQQTEFLGSLPCFNGWPFHFLRDVYININKRVLNRGDYVFREGDKPTFIAIVTKGKFVVYKEFLVQKPLIVEEKNIIDVPQNEKNSKKKKQEVVRNVQPFNINESSRKVIKETKKILELGDKDLFGEDDILRNRKRLYSVKCESSEGGEIIIITKQVFKERILSREIANRTIHSRIPLKEQIFQERVELIEQNLQNYKNLLRENRAELQSDIIKEKKLLQEQEEYYKKYFSNQTQDLQQKDNSFEVISSSNKNDFTVKNHDFSKSVRDKNYEIGSFTAMHSNLINIDNHKYSQETRGMSATSPCKNNLDLAVASLSPAKSIKHNSSKNSPKEDKKEKNQTHQQFFVEQLYIPPLNDLSNENFHAEKKYWPQNLQNNNIEDELDIRCLQETYYPQSSNRKNMMMDEKGNGVPLIDPMKNEEDLDRQVKKHLQIKPKRKNYLGEWRKGINQIDKVYGILRNAGYFDEKLQDIKGVQLKNQGSQLEENSPQVDSFRNTRKGAFQIKQSFIPSKTYQEFNQKKIVQEKLSTDNNYKSKQSQDNKEYKQISRKQSKDESNDMMDYYLNQSNLNSVYKREECGYDSSQDLEYVYHNQIFPVKINNISTNESPLICQKKQKFNTQNSSNRYSTANGGAFKKNIGAENNFCINLPLNNNGNPILISQNNTLNNFYQQQQQKNQNNLQPHTQRELISQKRKSQGNSSYREGQNTVRDIDSRITNRGHQENNISPFNFKNQYSLPNSARQSRQRQRTPIKNLQDMQRSFSKNKYLKSSTPIDHTHRNISQKLQSLNDINAKQFKEFNPSQNPLIMKQEFLNELEIKDPYFANQYEKSNERQQNKQLKAKQTMIQFMNRHTQRQKLLITEDTRATENKSLISEDIIDYSKTYLSKIKKKIQSKDNSFYQQQLSFI